MRVTFRDWRVLFATADIIASSTIAKNNTVIHFTLRVTIYTRFAKMHLIIFNMLCHFSPLPFLYSFFLSPCESSRIWF